MPAQKTTAGWSGRLCSADEQAGRAGRVHAVHIQALGLTWNSKGTVPRALPLARSFAHVCPCRLGKQFWTATYTQRDDGVVLSVLAFMAAFFGVWAGSKLKLDYSAKLFTMTFLLVTFGAVQDNSALRARAGLPVHDCTL